MRCPGRTTNVSPGLICSTGTSVSTPPRRTVAVFAPRFSSERIALDAAPLDVSSKYLPIVINTSTAALTSKNMWFMLFVMTTHALYT